MHGLPADAREDHIWIKKNGTRGTFTYISSSTCVHFFHAPVYKILLCPISGKIIFYFFKQMVRLYGA